MIDVKCGGTSLPDTDSIRRVVAIVQSRHVPVLVAPCGACDARVSFVVPPEREKARS